ETLMFESADGKIVGSNKEEDQRQTTNEGLGPTSAQATCDIFAKQEFIYGGKLHWITGKLAEDIREDEIFLKVTATVTNEYGTKMKGVNVECYVSGTDSNPQITDFLY